MDKWEASFISVLSQVGASALIIVSTGPPFSLCLAKLRPCISLCTEGNNNTPNPPFTALLTQSIPHGVKRRQIMVMSARYCVAVCALTRQTLVGDNEQNSAVMAMTLFVREGRSARGDSQLAWSVWGTQWVGGWESCPPGLCCFMLRVKCTFWQYV